MADALPGVTTGYTLSSTSATAITSNTTGSPHRKCIILSNLDAAITVFYAFGTANGATNSGVGHPLVAGATVILGGPAPIGMMGNAGIPVPAGDISVIAASGTPKVAVTILG